MHRLFIHCITCFTKKKKRAQLYVYGFTFQQIQRALVSTSSLVCASAWCSLYACWSSASHASLRPRLHPLLQRKNSWRTLVRMRRMKTVRRMKRMRMRKMQGTWRSLSRSAPQRSRWITSTVHQTGTWTCSPQRRSWSERRGWRKGRGSSGRSGEMDNQTYWVQGLAPLEGCITISPQYYWLWS